MYGKINKYGLYGLIALSWALLYALLPAISAFLVQGLVRVWPTLNDYEHFKSALAFFLYDTPKVLLLLVMVVFVLGILRSFFSPEHSRRILAGNGSWSRHILAALLGSLTPFCSCSAVPLFIGFLSAGVPLGVTFSFLISAPMVNEVALVLLFGLFGWKIAALYWVTGLVLAVVSGFALGRMRLESGVEDWVWEIRAMPDVQGEIISWEQRVNIAKQAVSEIVGKVWKWVVLGIALGAVIHGYIPDGFFAQTLASGSWWSVPLAVVLGVPMYSNAAGVVPVISALLHKGVPLGTVLSWMMAVIALSLPEAILLRKVLKPRLLAVFFALVACGIIGVGYLFNAML